MRVVVVGATGNIGTSVVRALSADPSVTEIVGIARRRPDWDVDGVTWVPADVATDDLTEPLRGADAVVHLAWLLQPTRDETTQWRVNVVGSRRLLDAVAAAGVGAVVYSSSIGAYSPAPPGVEVTEDHPTDGVATCGYSRQKAYVERLLDAFEARHPDVRVVRIRPAVALKPEAASEIRRLFGGPFVPTPLLRRFGVPVWPATRGLALQAVHADDLAEAFRLAVTSGARGAFNIAADPVLEAPVVAEALDATTVPTPGAVLRAAAATAWHLRLQPLEPGWIDLALAMPRMSSARARTELGWHPAHAADAVLREFIAALGENRGADTPPLSPASSGPGRIDELRTGVGRRSR